jgi:hypothetical protein
MLYQHLQRPYLYNLLRQHSHQSFFHLHSHGYRSSSIAYPYEGFALGVAVVASTTPAGSQPTSLFTASGSMVSPSTAGTIAGIVICVLIVAGLLVAAVFFALRYRRKRMTAVKTQQYFGSQISNCAGIHGANEPWNGGGLWWKWKMERQG